MYEQAVDTDETVYLIGDLDTGASITEIVIKPGYILWVVNDSWQTQQATDTLIETVRASWESKSKGGTVLEVATEDNMVAFEDRRMQMQAQRSKGNGKSKGKGKEQNKGKGGARHAMDTGGGHSEEPQRHRQRMQQP